MIERAAPVSLFETETLKALQKPVSYTHLDVYKRQGYGIVGAAGITVAIEDEMEFSEIEGETP